MPRKSPIKKREKEIGNRLRAARIDASIPMTSLAKKIGVNVNTLSSYEHGRNPVPYFIAAKIAKATNFCERWIATGKGPQTPFFGVNERVEDLFPEKSLFSEIYDKILAEEFEQRFETVAHNNHCTIDKLNSSHFTWRVHLFATPLSAGHVVLESMLTRAGILCVGLPTPILRKYVSELQDLNEKYLGNKSFHKHMHSDDAEEESSMQEMLRKVEERLKK